MPQNIEGSLHVDRYLTDYSETYVQDEGNFVAQRATSVIPVQKSSDKFLKLDRGYFWRDEVVPRPLGGRPEQASYNISSDTYTATEYALEHVVDDRQRANADDPLDLDRNATRLLTQKHMIKRDRVWASTFFTTGVWTTDVTGVASSAGSSDSGDELQFDQSGSTPVDTVDRWKDTIGERTGMMPNTIVMGAKVKRELRSNTDIKDRIKYTRTGVADTDMLASLFGVDNVVVPRSVYNTAAEGATDSFSYIVGAKDMLLVYIEPNPTLDSPTGIATFAWTGLLDGQANAMGGVLERGRDERAHSDWFQMRMAWDMKLVSPDLGVFFNGIVS